MRIDDVSKAEKRQSRHKYGYVGKLLVHGEGLEEAHLLAIPDISQVLLAVRVGHKLKHTLTIRDLLL